MVGHSFEFPSSCRLKNRSDFSRLHHRGRMFSADRFLIQWGRSSKESARLGITVSRRFGSSVDRNLFRRRAKEAFRQSELRTIPGIDVNLKPKGSFIVSYAEFLHAFERFAEYIRKQPSEVRTSSPAKTPATSP